MTPLEMYELAETQWSKLLHEEKENTPIGEGWSKEMDYWWSRLTVEERLKLISTARKELEEKFSKSYMEMFPGEKL